MQDGLSGRSSMRAGSSSLSAPGNASWAGESTALAPTSARQEQGREEASSSSWLGRTRQGNGRHSIFFYHVYLVAHLHHLSLRRAYVKTLIGSVTGRALPAARGTTSTTAPPSPVFDIGVRQQRAAKALAAQERGAAMTLASKVLQELNTPTQLLKQHEAEFRQDRVQKLLVRAASLRHGVSDDQMLLAVDDADLELIHPGKVNDVVPTVA